jgi:hypothetical protein
MASYYCQHIEKHFCKFLQIFVLVIKLDQKIYRVMARREVQSELIILKKNKSKYGFYSSSAEYEWMLQVVEGFITKILTTA